MEGKDRFDMQAQKSWYSLLYPDTYRGGAIVNRHLSIQFSNGEVHPEVQPRLH
jgi:hypothetical protein